MRTAILSAFALAALATTAASQCLIESFVAGSSASGSQIAAGDGRLAIVSNDSSAALLSVDADGTSGFLSSAGYFGPVDDIDADGTKYVVASEDNAGNTYVAVWETDATNAIIEQLFFDVDEEVSVALTTNSGGDWLAVGRPDDGAPGVVELYNRPPSAAKFDPYSFHSLITAPAAESAGMRFGFDVALGGDTLAMSAPLGDQGATDGGHVYIYRWNGTSWIWNSWWVGGNPGEQRHAYLATNGQTVIAGAPTADNGATDGGSITFFEFDGSLHSPNTFWFANGAGAEFGRSVDIAGDKAIAGSSNGFAQTLRWNGTIWDLDEVLVAPGPGAGFGESVAIEDSALPKYWVGQAGFNGGEGAAHYFVIGQSTATADLGGALAGTNGDPVLSADTCGFGTNVTLDFSNMVSLSTFSLVIGIAEINTPFKGGVLVPSPDLVVNGLPTGLGSIPVSGAIPAGLDGFTFFFQGWIVDPAGPKGLAATNGLSVEFFE